MGLTKSSAVLLLWAGACSACRSEPDDEMVQALAQQIEGLEQRLAGLEARLEESKAPSSPEESSAPPMDEPKPADAAASDIEGHPGVSSLVDEAVDERTPLEVGKAVGDDDGPLVIVLDASGPRIDGRRLSTEELEQVVRKALESNEDLSLIVRADPAVAQRDVVSLMDRVRSLGVRHLAVAGRAK